MNRAQQPYGQLDSQRSSQLDKSRQNRNLLCTVRCSQLWNQLCRKSR